MIGMHGCNVLLNVWNANVLKSTGLYLSYSWAFINYHMVLCFPLMHWDRACVNSEDNAYDFQTSASLLVQKVSISIYNKLTTKIFKTFYITLVQ